MHSVPPPPQIKKIKINQNITWELNLIDHLRDIIKVEEENDVETNFQKASCTLEAGVKIYSLRVDSVHSEAYKVLGGINRACYENEQDSVMEDNNAATAQKGNPKKDLEKKLPLQWILYNIKHLRNLMKVKPKHMVLNMQAKDEISPTLKNIVNQFNEDNRRPLENFSCSQRSADQADTINNENEFNSVAFESFESDGFDHDDQPSIVDEEFNGVEPSFMSSEDVSNEENAATVTTKKTRNKKQTEPDIDFTQALDNEVPDIFAPPKNLKSLLLPSSRAPCNTKLPEDCHYQPEDLVKLFLLPYVMCLGRRKRKLSDESREQCDDYDPQPSWEEEGAFGGFDDEVDHSDVDYSGMLVSQPRQVSKIEVQYDKTSKQVDVQALKETLWDQIQQFQETSFQGLKHLLASFPADCKAAATTKEISPHLCFICLLHLSNEHGLIIHGCPDMDDLAIQLPHQGKHTIEALVKL
ncbi:Condensin complex subunit 2, putative isoform 2 [Hibiscus syriacus]|uniref:Condensin complex subunit 2 n=1 Tax=Hibiscus syriacus TaxID=106335 RepID=A0A6A2Z1Z3_HIBSY|nr:Condensin complex subunit 2, putative isoform 2 [Hibiscus syriacus]